MALAQHIGAAAATVGFDWTDVDGVLACLYGELDELAEARRANSQQAIVDEFGDVLFTLAQLARHLDLQADDALQQASQKFETRFNLAEMILARMGMTMQHASDQQRDEAWRAAKESLK